MNSVKYDEVLSCAKGIQNFKELVKMESKHKVLANAIASVASISPSEAIEFIREYYSRMDIVIVSPAVLFNDLNLKHK